MLGAACAVVALYFLGRLMVNRTVGLIAAAVFICHPQFLGNLTNARDYSWVMFVAVLSFIVLFRFADLGGRNWAVGCGVVCQVCRAQVRPVQIRTEEVRADQ